MPSFTEAITVALPGGYFDTAGKRQHQIWMRPWQMADAEALAALEGVCPARLASAILGRCSSLDGAQAAGSDAARALSVGDREALLLHLRRLTLGNEVSAVISCPSCGEKMDLDLRLSDLLLPAYDAAQQVHLREVVAGEACYAVRFRLPTGADQEAVAECAQRDLAGAIVQLVERCVESINGEPASSLPAAVLAELPDAMAALDPQADLMLTAKCVVCDAAFETLFDAITMVAREIERTRRELYRDVHLLASHYHWSEADILALSDRKRRLYLELIHAEWQSSGRQAS